MKRDTIDELYGYTAFARAMIGLTIAKLAAGSRTLRRPGW